MFEVAQRRRRPRFGRRAGRKCANKNAPPSQPIIPLPMASQQMPNHPPVQRSSCSASSACGGGGSGSNTDQHQMNPLVAKLLRGETLPPQRGSTGSPTLDRIFSEAKGPEYYREQIQICVSNPGRFLASWTLLVTLFGEVRLYDYVHKCAWTEAELKPFAIKEEDEERGATDYA